MYFKIIQSVKRSCPCSCSCPVWYFARRNTFQSSPSLALPRPSPAPALAYTSVVYLGLSSPLHPSQPLGPSRLSVVLTSPLSVIFTSHLFPFYFLCTVNYSLFVSRIVIYFLTSPILYPTSILRAFPYCCYPQIGRG